MLGKNDQRAQVICEKSRRLQLRGFSVPLLRDGLIPGLNRERMLSGILILLRIFRTFVHQICLSSKR